MRIIAMAALAAGLAGSIGLAGCGRGKQHETGTHEAAPPPAAMDAAVAEVDAGAPAIDAAVATAALPASCDGPLRGLTALVNRMHAAMEPQGPRAKAIAAWQAIEAPCRRSAWYLVAAQLERWDPVKLAAGGVTIATAEEAIVAGLAANDDRRILVLTGFAAALGGKPLLPKDACQRATAIGGDADDLAYVCGHAARAAGDHATALDRFTAIADARRYPDLALRKAEALAALARRDEAKPLFAEAAKLDEQAARNWGATGREYLKLVDDAKNQR